MGFATLSLHLWDSYRLRLWELKPTAVGHGLHPWLWSIDALWITWLRDVGLQIWVSQSRSRYIVLPEHYGLRSWGQLGGVNYAMDYGYGEILGAPSGMDYGYGAERQGSPVRGRTTDIGLYVR